MVSSRGEASTARATPLPPRQRRSKHRPEQSHNCSEAVDEDDWARATEAIDTQCPVAHNAGPRNGVRRAITGVLCRAARAQMCRSVLRLARRDPMFGVRAMARPHKAECREPGVGRTLRPTGAWSVGLVVRVRAAGVVGDVDHLGDLGHGFEDHGFDALAQGGGSHPAALTPAAEV